MIAKEGIVQCNSYVSFWCCGIAVAIYLIPDTPYVRKLTRKCVRVALGNP